MKEVQKLKQIISFLKKQNNNCNHIHNVQIIDSEIHTLLPENETCHGCLTCGTIFLAKKEKDSLGSCTFDEFYNLKNFYHELLNQYSILKSKKLIKHLSSQKVKQKIKKSTIYEMHPLK